MTAGAVPPPTALSAIWYELSGEQIKSWCASQQHRNYMIQVEREPEVIRNLKDVISANPVGRDPRVYKNLAGSKLCGGGQESFGS